MQSLMRATVTMTHRKCVAFELSCVRCDARAIFVRALPGIEGLTAAAADQTPRRLTVEASGAACQVHTQNGLGSAESGN